MSEHPPKPRKKIEHTEEAVDALAKNLQAEAALQEKITSSRRRVRTGSNGNSTEYAAVYVETKGAPRGEQGEFTALPFNAIPDPSTVLDPEGKKKAPRIKKSKNPAAVRRFRTEAKAERRVERSVSQAVDIVAGRMNAEVRREERIARKRPANFTGLEDTITPAVEAAFNELTPAERAKAEALGATPEAVIADIRKTREKGAPRRSIARPLSFTEAEPVATTRTPEPTEVADGLPRGVDPSALEKAAAARASSKARLEEKRSARRAAARTGDVVAFPEFAQEMPEEVALEGQERVPAFDSGDGNWTELPANGRAGRAVESAGQEPAPRSTPAEAERSAPESVSVAEAPDTVPEPAAVPRATLGAGMNREQLAQEISARRAELDTLNLKERRTELGSMDHDRYERRALELESEIRELESSQQAVAGEEARTEEIANIRKRLVGLEREAAQPRAGVLERVEPQILALEEEIRRLERGEKKKDGPVLERKPETHAEQEQVLAQAVAGLQTGPAETAALTAEEQMELAKKFSPEEAVRIFQSGGEGYITSAPGSNTPEAKPQAPVTPDAPSIEATPDQKEGPIVMVNSVLTKQALGGNKKLFEKFKKEGQFPAMGAAAPKAPLERRAEKEKLKQKKSRKGWLWGAAGLAGVLGALFLGTRGGKQEAPVLKAPEKPAAAKSAADAGVKAPQAARSSEAPPAVTVPTAKQEVAAVQPKERRFASAAEKVAEAQERNARFIAKIQQEVDANRFREDDAKMVMAWIHMAYTKAKEALPPGSDQRIVEVVEIIRRNQDNPYAFKPGGIAPAVPEQAQPAPAAPETPTPSTPEAAAPAPEAGTASAKLSSYTTEQGAQIFVVTGGLGAFDAAQRYAERLPEGTLVRFDTVGPNGEPLRGAFTSNGRGGTGMALRNPITGQPFAPVDASQLQGSRDLGADGRVAGE